MRNHVNRDLPVAFHDAETVAVALHLVNVGFASVAKVREAYLRREAPVIGQWLTLPWPPGHLGGLARQAQVVTQLVGDRQVPRGQF